MNCKEIYENMDALLGGEIVGYEKKMYLEHIQECQICKEEYLSEKELRRLLQAIPKITAPDNFDKVLWSKIRQRSSITTRLYEFVRHYYLALGDALKIPQFSPAYAIFMALLVILSLPLLKNWRPGSENGTPGSSGQPATSILARSESGFRLPAPLIKKAPEQMMGTAPVMRPFTHPSRNQDDIIPVSTSNPNRQYCDKNPNIGQPLPGSQELWQPGWHEDPTFPGQSHVLSSSYVLDSVDYQQDSQPISY